MRVGLPLIAALSLCLSACGGSAPGAGGGGPAGANAPGAGGFGGRRGGGGPVEVGVVSVHVERAALTAELPGRTVPYRIAQVRPQISGIIQKRLFEEGANVRAGQPLYQIDPGTYQATHDSASAAVAKAEANALTSKLRFNRITKLAETGAVSQQDRDDVTANLRQTEADLATARASLKAATINLGYTTIVAPISGRIATSDFTEGALVTANQAAVLTTIQQLDPMYIDLVQSSAEVMRLRQQFESGVLKSGGPAKASVKLRMQDGGQYPLEGTLEFTGVTVSETTGAITLRVVMPNPKGELLPGMYVRAVLEQGVTDNAILVPQRVVKRNDGGDPVVMIVDGQGLVAQRVLSTANVVGDSWLVLSGLSPGDQLIVEGQQKVKPGDKVKTVPGSLAAVTGIDPGNIPAPPSDAARGEGRGGRRGGTEPQTPPTGNTTARGGAANVR